MKNLFTILIFSISFNLYAQEESFPCVKANIKLKELFTLGKLDNLYIHDCSGPGLHELSSSFLKASGNPPEIMEDPDGIDPPDDSKYVDWTCKYSVGKLQDGNIETAWVEGVDGHGINEVVIVPCLDLKKDIEIFAGYGKSEKLFNYNSRPKKLKTVIIRAKLAGATQYGSNYSHLTVIKEFETELHDKYDFQTLHVPDFIIEKYYSDQSNTEVEYRYFLGVEILEVYKGTKWNDTCISEIRNAIE